MEEYLIWKRALESAKSEIENAETIIIINKELIRCAEGKLKKLPKPKIKENKPMGTG